ncbi:MAG TPA: hypothetical protein VMW10_03100 [Alphaproteobacteria bacterium]|nr:hypothetical protein [Alphaproteobacteria bacterium]
MRKTFQHSLVALTTLLLLSANVSAAVKGTKKGNLKNCQPSGDTCNNSDECFIPYNTCSGGYCYQC